LDGRPGELTQKELKKILSKLTSPAFVNTFKDKIQLSDNFGVEDLAMWVVEQSPRYKKSILKLSVQK